MINSLDERVAKGGANYSAGQRQLLSLARGLLKLRHSSILILDESTANLGAFSGHAISYFKLSDFRSLQITPPMRRFKEYYGIVLTELQSSRLPIDYDQLLIAIGSSCSIKARSLNMIAR
jgi:ABC-type taurine transport system ATPase subunit